MATIAVDGIEVPISRLRRTGLFTKIHVSADRARVFVQQDRGIEDKAILCAALARLPDSPHLPRIRLVAEDAESRWYEMPFYSTPWPRRSHPDYRALRPLRGRSVDAALVANLRPSLRLAFTVLIEEARRVSAHFRFDIYPRNLAVGADGSMVLLDPVCDDAAKDAVYRQCGWHWSRCPAVDGGACVEGCPMFEYGRSSRSARY